MRFLYSSFVLLSLICATTSSARADTFNFSESFNMVGYFSNGSCVGGAAILRTKNLNIGSSPYTRVIFSADVLNNALMKSEHLGTTNEDATTSFLVTYAVTGLFVRTGGLQIDFSIPIMSVDGSAAHRASSYDQKTDYDGLSGNMSTASGASTGTATLTVTDPFFLAALENAAWIDVGILGCSSSTTSGPGNLISGVEADATFLGSVTTHVK